MNEHSDKRRMSGTYDTAKGAEDTAEQMIVLGIRISPQITRYALVKSEDKRYELINADTESELEYPVDTDAPESKASWLYRELKRIIRKNPDIKRVCIKVNESRFRDQKSSRETYRLEGVALLLCDRCSKPVNMKTYKSLGTRKADVMACAEDRVGSTSKYWNPQMADAVVAAWSGHQSSVD